MAFHDVLFDDPVTIAGVEAWRADNGLGDSLAARPVQRCDYYDLGSSI